MIKHNTVVSNYGGDGVGIHVEAYEPSTVVISNTIIVGQTAGVTVTSGDIAIMEGTLWGNDAWGANDTDWGGDGTIITGTINLRRTRASRIPWRMTTTWRAVPLRSAPGSTRAWQPTLMAILAPLVQDWTSARMSIGSGRRCTFRLCCVPGRLRREHRWGARYGTCPGGALNDRGLIQALGWFLCAGRLTGVIFPHGIASPCRDECIWCRDDA